MGSSERHSRLGALILLWLLTQSSKRTLARLCTALEPLLKHRRSSAEQRDALDREIAALEQAKLLTRVNKSGLDLTDVGRRAAIATLGLPELPSRATWRAVKDNYLIALSLGSQLPLPTNATKRLGNIDGLRAAIVAQHYHLKTGVAPTSKQVKDALAWRQLGVETDKPLTREALLQLLLNQLLGEARSRSSDGAIEQLAAKAVGASRSDATQLRLAAQRRWLDEQDLALAVDHKQSAAPLKGAVTATADLADDKAFAARVLAAARATKSGRFGDNKVFISHVFQHLKNEGAIRGELDAFKARLGAAHFRGLLELSRADLVEAMAAEDVDASEMQHEHATFHFVRI